MKSQEFHQSETDFSLEDLQNIIEEGKNLQVFVYQFLKHRFIFPIAPIIEKVIQSLQMGSDLEICRKEGSSQNVSHIIDTGQNPKDRVEI